jgi:hypothetical protein
MFPPKSKRAAENTFIQRDCQQWDAHGKASNLPVFSSLKHRKANAEAIGVRFWD